MCVCVLSALFTCVSTLLTHAHTYTHTHIHKVSEGSVVAAEALSKEAVEEAILVAELATLNTIPAREHTMPARFQVAAAVLRLFRDRAAVG